MKNVEVIKKVLSFLLYNSKSNEVYVRAVAVGELAQCSPSVGEQGSLEPGSFEAGIRIFCQ